MNPIAQFIVNLLNGLLGGLSAPIQPLLNLIGFTPLELSTANPVINALWLAMTLVADVALGLFVTVAAIQVMYGQATGTLYMPVGQFVTRAVLTAILIHASGILLQDVLILNNELCGALHLEVQQFILQANGGNPFNGGQVLNLTTVLAIVFGVSALRVVFQAVKRVVFFDLLYVLAGPAFLMSFHPGTSAWFAYWLRTTLTTAFSQFLQFLAISLGIQFLITSKQTGPAGFLLASAMLNLAAEIPDLLARFAASAGASVPGAGSLLRSAVTAAAVFA